MQHISIKSPFDPSMIEVEVKNITIGVLVDMLKNNAIDLAPAFQRKKDIWNRVQKSKLIESILLNLPLPSFYFAIEERSKQWIIIDGLQRLSTLKSFVIDSDLKLEGLDFFGDQYNGKKYEDFAYFEKLDFSMLPITVNLLKGSTPPEVKYLLFQRINSAGTPLSPQEMRNALNQGPASEFLKDVSESEPFCRVMGSVSNDRMEAQEYILRFISFYLYDYTLFKDDMNAFLASAMSQMNSMDEEQLNLLKAKFFDTLEVCYSLLGDNAFRKPTEKQRRNKISKAMFDSMMYGVANLSEREQKVLLAHRTAFVEGYNLLSEDTDFQKVLSQGTGKLRSVQNRFNRIRNLMNNVLRNYDSAI